MTSAQGRRSIISSFGRISSRKLILRFSAVTVASLVSALFDALGIALLVPLANSLTKSNSTAHLAIVGSVRIGVLVGIIVTVFAAKTITSAAIRWWSSGIVAKSSVETATVLFDTYMHAPLEFHDSHNSAQIVNVLQGALDRVYSRGFMGVVTIVTEGTTLLVLAVVVIFSSPVATIAGITYFGVASSVYLRLLQPRLRAKARQSESANAAAVRTLQEGLGGLREHRVRAVEPYLVRQYCGFMSETALSQRIVLFMMELSRYYLELLFVGGFGIITGITLATGSRGDALTGLALVLGVGFRVLPSVSRVLSSFVSVRAGATALGVVLDDLDDLGIQRLENQRTITQISVADNYETPIGLHLSDVAYSYPGGSTVLTGVSLDVPAGTSLGIVGPSGAGKSTLIDLICGLRRPSQGRIEFDGGVVGARVGLVPQDVFLLDNSITHNVAFGLEIDDDQINDALRRAQLIDFVNSLPDGVQTFVGERGTRLSGGQRQRMGIARALYRSPAVLVLDEATAALDVETEDAVVNSVQELTGNLTVIVVAHRLTTIRRCDQVAFLEQGHLSGVGKFDDLVQALPALNRAAVLAGLVEPQ